jgi:hypothetical protein
MCGDIGWRALGRTSLSSYAAGKFTHAKSDVCIVDRSQDDIILLVQEDKRMEETKGSDPTAQLVTAVLPAFAENNRNRVESGLPPLQQKVLFSFIPPSRAR